MNKYQDALNKIVKSCCPNCIDENGCSSCDIEKICNATAKSWVNTLQELINRNQKLEKVINILKDRLIDYQGMEFQKRWYDGEEEYHYFLVFDENFEIELVDENQFKFLKEVFENE